MVCHGIWFACRDLDGGAQCLTWISNRYERYAELKLIFWPILEQRLPLRQLRFHIEICEQHQHRVCSYEYEYMPKAVQIWKVDCRPGLAKHPIVDPTKNCHAPNCGGTQAQTINALITNSADEKKKSKQTKVQKFS